MTAVPPAYQAWVQSAATSTGLPPAVVAAQINTESGFNPQATSPTGAQGIAQIEPGTWAGLGIPGTPYNPQAALQGYSKLMRQLLAQFHGNVRDALAAYNAGAGNLSAGYGYADHILGASAAGNLTVGFTPAPSPGSGAGGLLAGLGGSIAGVPVAGAFVVLGGLVVLALGLWAGGVPL